MSGLHLLPVYVAAPYPRAAEVRAMHNALNEIGCVGVSHWATCARETFDEALANPRIAQSALELNDRCLEQAVVIVALAFDGEGGEMFAEVGRALAIPELAPPVLWIGQRLVLSCFRTGVYVVSQLEAFAALEHVARGCLSGHSLGVARQRLHHWMRRKAERDAAA